MSKILSFEYLLYHLVAWFCDIKNLDSLQLFNEHNDLSKLKVLKLHFFVCSANTDLLTEFDEFHALPYGHVESDIYNNLSNLERFNVDDDSMSVIAEYSTLMELENSFDNLPDETKTMIKVGIDRLKKENQHIVEYTAFNLVELSHTWLSWNSTIRKAREIGSEARKIPSELIEEERKTYRFSL